MTQAPSRQEIIDNYLQTLANLSHTRTILRHYPALVFPQSLLPHPKTKIRSALIHTKEDAFLRRRFDLIPLYDEALDYLNLFIDDSQANYRNKTN